MTPRTFALAAGTLAAACLVLPAPARAQIQFGVSVALPTIRFVQPPPLVVVTPGIQVVADCDEEVFYVGGWYWVRHGSGWYRTRDHRGGWVLVADRELPRGLVRLKPGKYRHFRPKGWDRGRRGWDEDEHEHEHGHGHGHGHDD